MTVAFALRPDSPLVAQKKKKKLYFNYIKSFQTPVNPPTNRIATIMLAIVVMLCSLRRSRVSAAARRYQQALTACQDMFEVMTKEQTSP